MLTTVAAVTAPRGPCCGAGGGGEEGSHSASAQRSNSQLHSFTVLDQSS